jgi:hypothetical protein
VALKQKKIVQRTSYAFAWLVFLFIMGGCKGDKRKPSTTYIIYEDSTALAMMIPRELFKEVPDEMIIDSLRVYVKGATVPVLGTATIENDDVMFEPVVPLTAEMSYEVKLQGELITTLSVPPTEKMYKSGVTAIYPSAEIVPENLLKFYIVFAQPMQEGYAFENIILLRNDRDTVTGVFLDLQPELWNSERTILTLWLDPGRIKRDLQPNKKMGNPLQQGDRYRLLIKKDWRNAGGKNMETNYHKEFKVGPRDSLVPDHRVWMILPPEAGSPEPLYVDMKESLDYILLKNAVRIKDKSGKTIQGVFDTKREETRLVFTPSEVWKAGDYIMEIENRLEDLAGNNLNRLFDKDITKKDNVGSQEVYRRYFSIK